MSRSDEMVADVLDDLGIAVSRPSARDARCDLVIAPGEICVQVKRWSLVDAIVAEKLVRDLRPEPGTVLLAVGDRVTKEARELLLANAVAYYDVRGHLALRTPTLVVDTEVAARKAPDVVGDGLAGQVGLEVATSLLMRPDSGLGVRQLARQLGRAPSTVSAVFSSLRREGLVDEQHRVVGTDLFWRVAERWPTPHTFLRQTPPPGERTRLTEPLRLGLGSEDAVGWALTESQAAGAYGAPLAVRDDEKPEFYVPDQLVQQRAVRLLGESSSPADAACGIRVAPVPAVCSHRVELPAGGLWPLAAPVFVALDLAQDGGRGRAVLEDWNPPAGFIRVW